MTTALIRHKEGKVKLIISEEHNGKEKIIEKTTLKLYDMSEITPLERDFDNDKFIKILHTREGQDALFELRNEKANSVINEYATMQKENLKTKVNGKENKIVKFINEIIKTPIDAPVNFGVTKKQIWNYFIKKGLNK